MALSKHLYLIGIAGVGTVWIADYALAQGWKVSGTELISSPITERLAAAGADIHIGSNPAAIPEDITEVVMTAAITPSAPHYPEYEELVKRGIPIHKRAEWIGKLTREKYTIAVCGAHGKTTTSAMIGWILAEAGLDPTVFTGSTVTAWGNATRIGKSKYLVLEADEFDRSFHHFSPQMAVVLNIDLDHTDYYTKGLPEIEQSYRRFLRNLPYKQGVVVGYGRDGRVRKVARGFKYHFRWYDEEHLWPGIKLLQPGLHNRLNATAAARIAHELGVDQKTIKKALATFPGTGRRFEHVKSWGTAELYDDYAHHPAEIMATLRGIHEQFPDKRVTVIFQPHQKARTVALRKEFGRAFDEYPPTRLILAPIYFVAGREEDIAISSADIATEIAKKPVSMEVQVATTIDELKEHVLAALPDTDIIMTMGAGNIRTLVEGWQ
jgi:UDP-N-acetylmuramate--alanine ligase